MSVPLRTSKTNLLTWIQFIDTASQLKSTILEERDFGSISLNLSLPGPDLRITAYEALVNHLSKLGSHWLSYFKSHGDVESLNASISFFKQAVEVTSETGPLDVLLHLVGQYVNALEMHFVCCGAISNFQKSVDIQRKTLESIPDNHPQKARLLCDFGGSLGQRFAFTGNITDIADAIKCLLQADTLTDDDYPFKEVILSNLGSSLGHRYSALGDIKDLEASVEHKQRALMLVKDDNPRKPQLLSNLGLSQLKLFGNRGSINDLEKCIQNYADAIRRTPDGEPLKIMFIHRMAAAKITRFRRLGQMDDLEDSIAKFQQAVSLTKDGDPQLAMYLSGLGTGLHARFLRLRELSDLEHALSIRQRSVALLDDGHSEKPQALVDLAESEMHRFERFENRNDLEHSITNMEQALFLNTHHRPEWFSNLAGTLQVRYSHFGSLSDLESAIVNLRTALRLTESSHPDFLGYLSNLGDCLSKRYEALGREVDLKEAVDNIQVAVQSIDDGHPEKIKYLFNLGKTLALRYKHTSHPEDAQECISALRAASQTRTIYPDVALLAARRWVLISHSVKDYKSTLDALKTALEILPKLAWLGLSAKSRQDLLQDEGSEKLSTMAAACAIRLGRLETAVELLDVGRSVMWQQASLMRADLERLREVDPHLAEQLDMLGQRLNSGNFVDDAYYTGSDRAEADEPNRHRLVDLWEGVLDSVRKLPQFEHFLRPLPFSQLRQAAKGGHIVIINVCVDNGVDALIFDSDKSHPIEHVHLPNLDSQSLNNFSSDIILKRPLNGTAEQHRRYLKNFFRPALRAVWEDLIIPIFAKMGISTSNPHTGLPERRVWWYPTGPLSFFPIHAAGPSATIDVSRLVVSSYISTADSLLKSHRHKLKSARGPPKLLAVSQPHTAGQNSLPMCTREVAALKKMAQAAHWPASDILHLDDADATVSCVSAALDTSSYIHFACHGLQHPSLGMKSAFALHDGLLELAQIASKRVSTGRFAFLSVCHAAAGLRDLPGENMHLAAGLQFCGFPSVVGTMWSISDDDAPVVAEHVYQHLLRDGVDSLDSAEGAVALNRAVLKLREDPKIPVDRWAPFIHLGV